MKGRATDQRRLQDEQHQDAFHLNAHIALHQILMLQRALAESAGAAARKEK